MIENTLECLFSFIINVDILITANVYKFLVSKDLLDVGIWRFFAEIRWRVENVALKMFSFS